MSSAAGNPLLIRSEEKAMINPISTLSKRGEQKSTSERTSSLEAVGLREQKITSGDHKNERLRFTETGQFEMEGLHPR